MDTNLHPYRCDIRQAALDAGAVAVGFASIEAVADSVTECYSQWLSSANHGEMSYLEKYTDIRRDPSLLLPGAKTLISMAFAYDTGKHSELFADYALGDDYHEVLREKLKPVCEFLSTLVPDSQTRICVDTAPLFERYWAVQAGIGFLGKNSMLIVPGIGSKVFLAEILWTEDVEPDEPCKLFCGNCGACLRACPGGAISDVAGLDARKCRSYLTIEFRGELPDNFSLPGRIYGCDICQDVCPHNKPLQKTPSEAGNSQYVLSEFQPRQDILSLDIERLRNLSEDDYKTIFRGSAIRRAKLPQLLRNASHRK